MPGRRRRAAGGWTGSHLPRAGDCDTEHSDEENCLEEGQKQEHIVDRYLQVVVLDGHEEGEQRLLVDLEGVTESPLLEYLEGGGSQHSGVADGAGSREHIQTPSININLVLMLIISLLTCWQLGNSPVLLVF